MQAKRTARIGAKNPPKSMCAQISKRLIEYEPCKAGNSASDAVTVSDE